jgi:DNA-binding NarL/FixJ family response regulator
MANADQAHRPSSQANDPLKIVAGVRLTDIADEFNLSIKTVSTHKSRILQKMHMSSDTDLVRYAIAKGLATMPE